MSNRRDAIACIFARGGSKGLPGKNIKVFNGKPLIAWAIEHAYATKGIRRVIVSTDTEEIASIALQYGAEVPFMRPSQLASDDAPEWLAWQHALDFISKDEGSLPDAMVSVPVTAPLRLPEDIENCLQRFNEDDVDAVITVTDAHRNPFFNMVSEREDHYVELVIQPSIGISRRQDAPIVFDMTTVAFVVDPEFVLNNNSIFSGRVKAVHVPVERSIDIDTLLDFEIAEFLASRRNVL